MSDIVDVKTTVAIVPCDSKHPCPKPISYVGITTGGGDPGIMPNPEQLPSWISKLDAFLQQSTHGQFRVMLLAEGTSHAHVSVELDSFTHQARRTSLRGGFNRG